MIGHVEQYMADRAASADPDPFFAYGKDSNGPLRGVKRDAWDGGPRVPFVVRWPGQAAAGMKTSELTSLTGSNPGDPEDSFRITGLQDHPDAFSVTWPSTLDRNYAVYWTTNFDDWYLYSEISGTGGLLSETLDNYTIDNADGVPGNLTRLFVRTGVAMS